MTRGGPAREKAESWEQRTGGLIGEPRKLGAFPAPRSGSGGKASFFCLLETGSQYRGEAAAEHPVWRRTECYETSSWAAALFRTVEVEGYKPLDPMPPPCSPDLARWPALGEGRKNSKVKGSGDRETRWLGDLTHPGAAGRKLVGKTLAC